MISFSLYVTTLDSQTWNSNERLLERIVRTQYKANIQLCVSTATVHTTRAIKDAANLTSPYGLWHCHTLLSQQSLNHSGALNLIHLRAQCTKDVIRPILRQTSRTLQRIEQNKFAFHCIQILYKTNVSKLIIGNKLLKNQWKFFWNNTITFPFLLLFLVLGIFFVFLYVHVYLCPCVVIIIIKH